MCQNILLGAIMFIFIFSPTKIDLSNYNPIRLLIFLYPCQIGILSVVSLWKQINVLRQAGFLTILSVVNVLKRDSLSQCNACDCSCVFQMAHWPCQTRFLTILSVVNVRKRDYPAVLSQCECSSWLILTILSVVNVLKRGSPSQCNACDCSWMFQMACWLCLTGFLNILSVVNVRKRDYPCSALTMWLFFLTYFDYFECRERVKRYWCNIPDEYS